MFLGPLYMSLDIFILKRDFLFSVLGGSIPGASLLINNIGFLVVSKKKKEERLDKSFQAN